MPTEQDQFLEELKGNEKSVLDNIEVKPEVEEKKDEVDPEQVEEKLKNRQHRRLEAKLQSEREANIALNAKLQALSEVDRFKRDEPNADLHAVLYGSQAPTEETKEVARRLQTIMENNVEKAEKRALEAIRKEQAEEARKLKEEESQLDTIIENLEEDHGVSLTKEQREGYFKLLEKMSPKDSGGEVIAYADPEAVWEEYQSKLQSRKTESKAKFLADRSLNQGGSSGDSKLQQTAHEKWLKENGII